MFFVTFYRIIRAGFVNFWRNKWLSFTSSGIMTITLIIFAILLMSFVVTQGSLDVIKQKVDISAYFNKGLSEQSMKSVKTALENDPRVASVTYISAEEALSQFKLNNQDKAIIQETLNEVNSNPLPASLQIKARNLEDYESISQTLGGDQYKAQISEVNFAGSKLAIERLNTLLHFIVIIGLIMIVIFTVIALIVMFNTITLTIYNRREEIEIMRLVGATNIFIRGPFLIEALLYSLLATIVTSILLLPLYNKVVLPVITRYLGDIGNTPFTESVYTKPYILIPAMLIISFILSMIASTMAIRKYLKI